MASDALSLSSTYTLNNGVKIPVIGFGTYQLAQGKESQMAALSALQNGYRLIDTAALYANEKDVASAIETSKIARKDIFVTTKLWNTDHHQVEKAFLRSQSNLGPIDLYLMHWPVEKLRLASWKSMASLYAAKKCRAIGVSNFTVRHLEELLSQTDVVPAVNQVEFSPFLFQKELLDYCTRKDIRLEAYCPLIRGQKASHPILVELASKHNKSWAQILLRWNLQHGVIPLPRSKTPGRIKENIDIFDFSLSPADMKKLDSLNEDFRVSWNPEEIV